MSTGKERPFEKEKEEEEKISSKVLSFYLIWSVIISLSVIVIGVITYLATDSTGYLTVPVDILLKSYGPNTAVFPHYLGTITYGVLKFKSFAIIQLGVLLLILSPFGRIFIQVLIYARERDRKFMVIAATVFAVLLFSLYLSRYIH